MRQNKSVFTRRFNKIRSQLEDLYIEKSASSECEIYGTASLRWGPEMCVVAHDGSMGFTIAWNDLDGSQTVQIVRIDQGQYKGGLVGIFVRETDLNHLMRAIETALKDGFESIYVESIASGKGA